MAAKNRIECSLERLIYASRWILAPIYFGMSLALLALCVKFFQELYHFIPLVLTIDESQFILKLLSLIDLTLFANLLVIVIFSGYENFVSQMDLVEDTEKLDWLGKNDYGALKIKVSTYIVAISAIELLKIFMNVQTTDNDKIMWYVLIHLTFVISALFMGWLNKLTKQ
jgi:uncharacterized protein (TIGR00645 family)